MRYLFPKFKAQDLEVWYGKDVEISINEKSVSRSIEQNAFFHGVILEVLERDSETGYTAEEFKIMLKEKYLSEIRYIGDEPYKIVKSTSKLTVKEFNKFIDECLNFASLEFGIVIEK